MLKYIPLFELPFLIIMVLIRSAFLRKHGIKAIVFGNTNKTDFIIIPFVLFFFYGLTAGVFNLPFPNILINPFWDIIIMDTIAIIICTISLIWFGLTLKVFGKSFRVGIDENSKDNLIVNGTFSISRNPIYVGFLAFFIGIFIAYSNILIIVFLTLFFLIINRQVLREELFLKEHYGNEYNEYCKKVRRYL
jgi:protein-S-isoprenylcysteine O-methyltransferase Ste14